MVKVMGGWSILGGPDVAKSGRVDDSGRVRYEQAFSERVQQMLDRAGTGQMQNDPAPALLNLDGDLEQLGDDGRRLRLRQRSMLQCLSAQLLVQDVGGMQ